jgi:hypothetical protein
MSDDGGDPACWTHLFDDRHDLATRRDVESLVRRIYRAAAMDDVLGPVFTAAHLSWPDHLSTVTDFWMWQLFGVRGYEGNPLRAHRPAHTLKRLLAGESAGGDVPLEVVGLDPSVAGRRSRVRG